MPKSPAILGYGIAVLSAAAAVAAGLVFDRPSGGAPLASLFLCTIMFVAWAAGTGPALLATALTMLAFDYFFLPPVQSFSLQLKDVPQLALLAIAALVVVSLSAAQRRAAERARLAEQGFKAIVDTIPALAARHRPDGTIDFVNQTWRSYTGFTQQSWPDRGRSAVHPDDFPRIERVWLKHLASGEPFETEQRLRRADGTYRWHVIRRVPLRDEQGVVIAWYGAGYDIEDRKRAEDALRQSEARLAEAKQELQSTIDSLPAFVATYEPDGTRSFINRTWRDFTGVSLEEATGAGAKTAGHFHPADAVQADRVWHASLASGDPFLMETRVRRADGEYRWHAHRRAPQRDAEGKIVRWYSVGVDIENQKSAETALRRSEIYSAEAQRLSVTGSFAWEIAGRENFWSGNHFWSEETYRIMGFDRNVAPSIDRILKRIHPDDRAIFQHQLDRAALGAQDHDYEMRLLMPDGQVRHVHVIAHRVTYESGKEELVGAMMDVTEARTSQETLHAARTALAHASRAATLGEISATIAHEVNQPLAAIVANGQACLRFLCRETPALEDVQGAVEWIVKDGIRAGEVIRRVRGLLKKAETDKVPLSINDTVGEVAALLHRELAGQHVLLRLELAPALPLAIADRVQLQQVIINLVVNGMEAMQTVTSRLRELVIRSSLDEDHQIVVTVKDSGAGIEAGSTGRLFEAFFSTKPDGLGMGLSICRSIIEDHGGRLWAAGNEGEPGTTFQFTLPISGDGR